jgi:hypothetical protein
MRLRNAFLAAALAIVGASACASGPSYADYQSSIPAMQSAEGRLWFYRPEAFVGGAMQPDVKINAQAVAKSTGGGFFFADRPAGQYTVTTATEAERALTLTLAAGEQKYIRMEPQMGVLVGTIKLVLVEPAVGQKEIGGTKYSGPVAK